ncbi:hypothetical protein KIPB_014356, partial [Kipferlia bialata]|eukprot:g14356.t1
MSLDRTPLLTE